MPDAHANFAYSTVAVAPSPATTGVTLSVATGDGAKYPAVPFNATIWPANTQPTLANAEIVRVTAMSGDNITAMTRTQEGTTARAIGVGDQIIAGITAKTLTDIEALLVSNPLNWRGAWSNSLSYAVNDVVVYEGVVYRCTTAVTGGSPSTFLGTGKTYFNGTAIPNIALPAGAVAGDLAIILMDTYGGSGSINGPTGSTALTAVLTNSTSRSQLYSYTLTATDVTNGYIAFPANANLPWAVQVHFFHDIASVDSAHVVSATSTASPSATITGAAFVYQAVTGTTNSTTGVAVSQSSLSGLDSESSNGALQYGPFCGAGYETYTSAGTSTSRTFTLTDVNNTETVTVPILLQGPAFQSGSFQRIGTTGSVRRIGVPSYSAYASGTASLTPSYPQAPTAGNLLLMTVAVHAYAAIPTIGTPTGWTQARTTVFASAGSEGAQMAIFYKVAAGGDAAPTVTLSGSGYHESAVVIEEWTGLATSSPLRTANTASGGSAAGPVILTAPLSGLMPGDFIFAAGVIRCAGAMFDWGYPLVPSMPMITVANGLHMPMGTAAAFAADTSYTPMLVYGDASSTTYSPPVLVAAAFAAA